MFNKLFALAAAFCLLAGCMELESDKFQAHRDSLRRGENPDVHARASSKAKPARAPQKTIKKQVENETDEDVSDEAEERQKAHVLSAIERLNESEP